MLILTVSPPILPNPVYIFCNFVKTLKSSNLRLNLLKAFAMKRLYPFVIAVILLISFSSCSVYRNSPTPDDVYYSPAKPVSSAAVTENNNPDYYSTPNENYVRMRVQNPEKWSYFDDYNYDYYGSAYSPYSYAPGMSVSIGFGTGFYSPYYYGGFGYYSPLSYYNSYYAWNNCYNPYYGGVVIVNGKNNTTPSYTRMSNFNPSAYQGKFYNSRPSTSLSNTGSSRSGQNYYNTNANSNFNRSSNSRPVYYNNTNTTPMRSSPSTFSSGGGSSGGGGGSFSRPHR
jgi:uncharacterized membrane protein YgcG